MVLCLSRVNMNKKIRPIGGYVCFVLGISKSKYRFNKS